MTGFDAFTLFREVLLKEAPLAITVEAKQPVPFVGLEDVKFEAIFRYSGKIYGRAITVSGELLADDSANIATLTRQAESMAHSFNRLHMALIAGYESFEALYAAGMQVDLVAKPHRVVLRPELYKAGHGAGYLGD